MVKPRSSNLRDIVCEFDSHLRYQFMLEILGIISLAIYCVSVVLCWICAYKDYRRFKNNYITKVSSGEIVKFILIPLIPIVNVAIAVGFLFKTFQRKEWSF